MTDRALRFVVPRWDLTPLFTGLDDPSFHQSMDAAFAGLDRLEALYDRLGIRAALPTGNTIPNGARGSTLEGRDEGAEPNDGSHATASAHAAEALDAVNDLHRQIRPLTAYLHAVLSTDNGNDRARAQSSLLTTRLTVLASLTARWEAWVRGAGAEHLVVVGTATEDHRFALHRSARSAVHRMSESEEDLAAALRPSGGAAWANLHRDISSTLLVSVPERPDGHSRSGRVGGKGTVIPMSTARGRATHPDPVVRRAAFDAELQAWQSVEVPLAAALNGAFGERVVINRRRAWDSDLDAALFANNVDRRTLDAMHAAVDDALPEFRRYLRAKASLHGHAESLHWSDLFAPPPADSGAEISWENAVERVLDAFATYDPSLVSLADTAVRDAWIDAEPRPGKVDGAYCLPLGDGTSRVLVNFDGSPKSIQTLAHELGHAFHNCQLANRTPLQRSTPMALAETASIFCETLMTEGLLADPALANSADPAATRRLVSLLDADLQGVCQVVVDIRSRFLFEQQLCHRRTARSVSPKELCELMTQCQESSYGDALLPGGGHPYMWAVKGHYFTPFYNWPYTFGLLFGLGLFQRFRADPDHFRRQYHDLLSRTGMADAVTLAREMQIDLHDDRFWEASTQVLKARIVTYVDAVASLNGT